ncbi:MAG: hypothetical protein ACP5QF_02785 [Desulfurella sp.]|uniref:hypothetical protein n=1 Tax=Desulfurella sp. TaxID=1962857 RepID=UPI003D130AAE
MNFGDISEIKLQIDSINLKNLQELLKIGEVVNAKVLNVENSQTTVNIKGNNIKAFSNLNLEKDSTLKLLVTKLEPFVELKILNIDSKENLNLKTMDNLVNKVILDNIAKSTLENVDEKTFGNYIKTSFETISNALLNNNIHINENVFIVIAYYIETKRFNIYVKSRKKLTKQKKLRQTLTIFSETPIGLIKIDITKMESMWANLCVYDKKSYELLYSCKKELKDYVKIPIKIILKQEKPSIETLKTISYIDIVI